LAETVDRVSEFSTIAYSETVPSFPAMSSSQTAPLSVRELKTRMETCVSMVMSIRRSVEEPALDLGQHTRSEQERFLKAVGDISEETVELAYNFCMFGVPSLSLVHESEWRGWVQHILATYDQGGVLASIVTMQRVQDYLTTMRAARNAVAFSSVLPVLEAFVLGLNGRPLQVLSADAVYTDTERLHVPAEIGVFDAEADNFKLYKAIVAHQWAQTWYGTWRTSLGELSARFPDANRALALVHALETIRLDACIGRELPGLHREMLELRQLTGSAELPPGWRDVAHTLRRPGASVQDSCRHLQALYRLDEAPAPVCYQGQLLPERTEAVIALRVERERSQLQQSLAQVLAEQRGKNAAQNVRADIPTFEAVQRQAPDLPDGFRVELRLQGEPIPPTHDVQQLLQSIMQDLGQIPQEYLVAAGHGAYRDDAGAEVQENAPPTTEHAELYDEWDYKRQQYRKDWCQLSQRDVHPQHDDFVAQTREKYRGLLKHLYRTFEALRGEEKMLKRQPHGDDIDIDAVVEAFADESAGLESSGALFTKRRRLERDVAVMFLVDMSGSTKGWINDIERESLVLLCESLEILGDRYAIYGFSGFTHKRCELFRIKDLDEDYSEEVRARISGIRPQDYTRMGVAIRHLTRLFQNVEAKTRLLVALTDGRPDDQDGYRGSYGIEDTRQALFEARYQGIHPYCITIDDEALEYLPHMYGAANFSVISDVNKLPLRVSDIYRRITI